MRMLRLRTRAASVLGGLVLGLAGCVGGQRPAVQYTQSEWNFGGRAGTKLVTEHYEVYTTLRDETLLAAIPDFVEAAYAQYQSIVPPGRDHTRRMPVFLFAARDEWETFTRRLTGERARIYLNVRNGGFSENGVTVIEYTTHATTFPLLSHEGWHQYLHLHVQPRVPAWLNEGLAVYCEGQRWTRTRLKAFDPRFNPARRNALLEAVSAQQLHPLRYLLETNPGVVVQGDSKDVRAYYAQVWALVMFLQEGMDGKYADRFLALLAALGEPDLERRARTAHIWSDRPQFGYGEALFRSFISEDLDTVAQEYEEYLRTFYARSRVLRFP
ncbi:MAG: hypothetical protein IPM18_15260 [Phycisphaerales bacterium]|nr:hypothetical protein [Phycisphaerales bacterium]